MPKQKVIHTAPASLSCVLACPPSSTKRRSRCLARCQAMGELFALHGSKYIERSANARNILVMTCSLLSYHFVELGLAQCPSKRLYIYIYTAPASLSCVLATCPPSSTKRRSRYLARCQATCELFELHVPNRIQRFHHARNILVMICSLPSNHFVEFGLAQCPSKRSHILHQRP